MSFRKLPLHTPENYLKAILESIILYNSHSRADISNWLFEGYKKANIDPNKTISKKTIVLELFSKWIQIWEDVALLGIMFAGQVIKENRDPYEVYIDYHTQQIVRFLYAARKGLPKWAILKIYGMKSARNLLRNDVINQEEYSFFKKEIDHMIELGRETFYNISREFIGKKRRNSNQIDYGFILNVYFQTKHGFKVIQPTETAKKLWQINDEDIALYERIIKLKWNRKIVKTGMFNEFSDGDVEKLMNQINNWSKVTREIALSQLEFIKDPYWTVREIRFLRFQQEISIGAIKPSRKESCLCKSRIEFENCCYKTIVRTS